MKSKARDHDRDLVRLRLCTRRTRHRRDRWLALAIAWLLRALCRLAAALVRRPAFACYWRPPSGPPRVTARELNQKDPGVVVVDEVLGQWLALAGARPLNW